MTTPLDGRRAAVVARPGPIAAAITERLTRDGAGVWGLSPPFADRDAAAGALAEPDPDVVVWADVEPSALVPAPMVGLGEHDWIQRCEQPINSALVMLQAAHGRLCGRDGRVVVVCPSLALEGAEQLVPLATAAEAQRLLAKSLARRWGGDGITVNVVSAPVAAWDPALPALVPDAARTTPALKGEGELEAVAAAVAWLVGPDAGRITGTTIGADAGAVMAP